MTKAEFAARLKNACAAVLSAQDELTEIDSRFGDADHGLTMAKIAGAIAHAADQAQGGIRSMLDDAATAVMTLNGGSAVPLWNTWLDGMQEGAPEGDEIGVAGLKAVFAKALEELDDMSGAKVGDKTMMDALIPASQAIAAYEGTGEDGLFQAAAQAAAQKDQQDDHEKQYAQPRHSALGFLHHMCSLLYKNNYSNGLFQPGKFCRALPGVLRGLEGRRAAGQRGTPRL